MNKSLFFWFFFSGFICSFLRAQEQKIVYLNDTVGISFIRIPAGSFTMGSDKNDEYAQKDEWPAHQVTISKDFYLGQFEVTQRQWSVIMGYNPSVFRHPDKPVDMVSWNDCQRFIKKLNQLGIGVFRLPTEAEWERSCLLGNYIFRDDTGKIVNRQLRRYAWYNSRSEGKSHVAGTKRAGTNKLYDMMGNVWEWVNDWYGPYPETAQGDPKGPTEGGEKTYRGGSWFNEPEALRPANRHRHPPHIPFTNAGLRLVLQVDSQ